MLEQHKCKICIKASASPTILYMILYHASNQILSQGQKMTTTTYSQDEIQIIGQLKLSLQIMEQYAQDVDSLYYVFPIDKGNNRKRWISAPKKELKHLQNTLLHNILYKASVHDSAHGFVPNRSIVTNARPHIQKNWVANFDIHSFFPSTKIQAVNEAIQKNFDFSHAFSSLLAKLLTLKGELPQGAPTSPHLANLVMWDVDTMLQKYSKENRLTYTRYADDLTFSGANIPRSIQNDIRDILSPFGYNLAYKKSKILGQHKRQMVTGLVVNEKLNLPRPMRKKLRAIIHDIKTNGMEHALGRSDLNFDQLLGHISLQHMWSPQRAQEQLMELATALDLV